MYGASITSQWQPGVITTRPPVRTAPGEKRMHSEFTAAYAAQRAGSNVCEGFEVATLNGGRA